MPSLTKVQTGFLEPQGPFTLDVGTASAPGLKFSDSAATGMFSPSTGSLAFSTGNTLNALNISSLGLVGIGTTNPKSRTHIFGLAQTTADITDSGNQFGFLRISDNNANAGSGGGIIFSNIQGDNANAAGFAAIKGLLTNGSGNTAGHLAFSTRNAVADTALSERLRIANSGNIGIGTTNPTEKLHVIGDLLLQSSIPEIKFRSPNGTANQYYMGANISDVVDGGFIIGEGSDIPTGTIRLSISESGNVGIGLTASGDALSRLHIRTTASSPVFIEPSDLTGNNTTGAIKIRGRRVDGNLSQLFGGMVILEKFSMNAAIPTQSYLGSILFGGNYSTTTPGINSGMTYGASISGISEGTFTNATTAPTSIVFNTGTTGVEALQANTLYGTEAMRIKSDGNVGIGATNPTRKLHVQGNAYINSVLELGAQQSLAFVGDIDSAKYFMKLGGYNLSVMSDGVAAGYENISYNSRTYYTVARFSKDYSFATYGFTYLATNTGQVGVGLGAGSIFPQGRLVVAQSNGDTYNPIIRAQRSSAQTTNYWESSRIEIVNPDTDTANNMCAIGFVRGGNDVAAIWSVNRTVLVPSAAPEGDLVFGTAPGDGFGAATEKVRVKNNGNVGIGTTNPTGILDLVGNTLRLRNSRTPASSTAAGSAGEICWDTNYIYVCTATNTWRRSALSTW